MHELLRSLARDTGSFLVRLARACTPLIVVRKKGYAKRWFIYFFAEESVGVHYLELLFNKYS